MNLYKVLKKMLAGIFYVVYNLKVHNPENIPDTGRYVVVSNHISLGDVLILAISCKRQIYFMAKKELFKIFGLAQLLKALGAFPVDRSGSAVSALKTAVRHLEQDRLLGLFPQGTRQRGKSVLDTEFKTGAAFCSYKASAGFIPVYIKTKGQRFCLFRRCDIYYGKPVEFDTLPFGVGGSDEYKAVTDVIKSEIYTLEELAYGGKYNG